ncbi:MAG TPA: hypothetical protein VH643_00620 [Gemmataceae bacterium]|jgi:hypothetical protein
MTRTLSLRWEPQSLSVFDGVVARFEASRLSFTEAEALKPEFWDAGEEARLREDERFCPTPWRRWTLANRELINEALFARMQAAPEKGLPLADAVVPSGLAQVFCPGDPRFILSNGIIRLAGQRDLTSAEGRERITQRLREARQRVFEAEPSEKKTQLAPDSAAWQTCFVCLEAEAGGLHLEAGPLEGLPSFVKRLAITAGPQTWQLLASNLRNRCWRISVHPTNEPYRWSAPGHEDLLTDELAPLTKEGLPAAMATVFRIDAAGVGRLMAEPVLNPGQGYRLLVPPALASVELKPGQVNTLRDGWRLWELEIKPDLEMELRSLVERLGVKLGESVPQARWVVTPAVAYRETSRGESYPCFQAGSVPTLLIMTEVAAAEGDLAVFLLASDELRPFPLVAGKEWIMELEPLPPGRYVVDVLHRSSPISPLRLAFAVEECSPAPVSARVEVRLGSLRQSFDTEGRLTLNGDLSALEPEELEVLGPPLWPVEVLWDSGRRWRLEPLSLGTEGRLDSSELLARTAERRQRSTLGDLHLDFGELGRAVLRHTRRPDPVDLRQRLAQMVDERGSTLAGLGGQFPLIRSLWLDPLLALLGYDIQEASEADLANAPVLTTALLLQATLREAGRIVRRVRWALVLAAQPTQLSDEGLRAFADRLCEQHGVPEALLTDGLLWTRHRGGTCLRARSWDLRSLVGPGAETEFESFWFDFGV